MSNNLQHYGVKGMKWGVRRYQKKDGTRKAAGKKKAKKTKKSKKKAPLSVRLPNAAVGVAAGVVVNSVTSVPFALLGARVIGKPGALAGSLTSAAVSIQAGKSTYDHLMGDTDE